MTSHSVRVRTLTFTLAVSLLLTVSPATSWAQPAIAPLFQDAAQAAAANRAGDGATDQAVMRTRAIAIDFAQLSAAATPGAALDAGAGLLLNLFPDATYTAVVDRIDRTTNGYVWIGHIPDVALSAVALAVDGSTMYGSVHLPDATFIIRPAAGQLHSVGQVDQRFFPEDGPIREPAIAAPAAQPELRGAADPAAADDGSFIDVMVVYTPAAALAAAGGVAANVPSAINALIANAISSTNTTYANSGITQRLRLAYTTQLPYTETGGSTGIETDLGNITNGAGAFSGVAALRNTYHADLVSLLTNTAGSIYCGIAWKMTTVSSAFAPYGYSVVEQSCAVGNLSFPHELGHNMGAGHDWFVDSDIAPYSYAHGYINTTDRWRTVMSYNNLCANAGFNCSRLQYWANPGLAFGGKAMGVAAGTNSSASCYANPANPACDADDHRTLNDTAATVANFRASAASPLSVTALTASRQFPVTAGTSVTWTATAAGGTAPYTYKFWVNNGSGWVVARDWSSSNTFTWTPGAAGSYLVHAWVRNAGSSADYDAYLGAGPLSVTSLPLTVSVNAPPMPVTAGAPVTWTASGSGGAGPYTYEFWLYDGAAWTLAQGWSASNTWNWTASPAGTYYVDVWIRNAGSLSTYDAHSTYGPVSVSGLIVTGITPDVTFPVSAGTPVTWTATAGGGSGPYTYQFWVNSGSGWVMGRDWSIANTWTWVPSIAGTHTVVAWARNAGSSFGYDAYKFAAPATVSAPVVLSVTSLGSSPAPSAAEVPVVWTATATGGVGPYTYQFWVHDGVAWTMARDWGSSNTFTWTPPSAGTYIVYVWVRNRGSSTGYDAARGVGPFVIGPPPVLSVSSLTSDLALPVPVGTPITWTASVRGGSGPYSYQFWVYDGVSWTIGQAWSGSSTWTWIPPASGTYFAHVWVRNAGSSSASGDAYLGSSAAPITAPAALGVRSLTPLPSPASVGAPVTWSATAIGGSGPYTYKFWVYDGTAWAVGQEWSTSNSWTWIPVGAGTYSVHVWVRNNGSSASYDAYGMAGPYAIADPAPPPSADGLATEPR